MDVQSGVKILEYDINQRTGEIAFDMWHGEQVYLRIDQTLSLDQFFPDPKEP